MYKKKTTTNIYKYTYFNKMIYIRQSNLTCDFVYFMNNIIFHFENKFIFIYIHITIYFNLYIKRIIKYIFGISFVICKQEKLYYIETFIK